MSTLADVEHQLIWMLLVINRPFNWGCGRGFWVRDPNFDVVCGGASDSESVRIKAQALLLETKANMMAARFSSGCQFSHSPMTRSQ